MLKPAQRKILVSIPTTGIPLLNGLSDSLVREGMLHPEAPCDLGKTKPHGLQEDRPGLVHFPQEPSDLLT